MGLGLGLKLRLKLEKKISDFGLALGLEMDDFEMDFAMPQQTNLQQFSNKSLPKWSVYRFAYVVWVAPKCSSRSTITLPSDAA